MNNDSFVYIMTNKLNTTLYIGVTNNLLRRVNEHKSDLTDGFTKSYKLHKLVYYEQFGDINQAIAREKQLKSGSRQKKIGLINNMNPNWSDLSEEFSAWDCFAIATYKRCVETQQKNEWLAMTFR